MKELDQIGRLLTDRNVNDVDLEGEDEQFGALMMVGHLFDKIIPILNTIRQKECPLCNGINGHKQNCERTT